jgi:hypothetical protein
MAVCYKCDNSLDDSNWMPSFRKRNQRICKSCYRSNFNSKNNKVNNPKALYINGKYVSRKDPRYKVFKPGNYKNIGDAIFEQSSYSQIKEGHVYIITNKAWPEWVKIGMAIDAEDRLSGYQTSSPHRDYKLEHSVYSNDRRKAEQKAHTKALIKALDSNGEWFKLSVEQAISILDSLKDPEPVIIEEVKPKDQPIQSDLWSYADSLKG